MKLFFSILFLCSGLQSFSQVIDHFQTKSSLCSSDLFLYADSTYAYESGCEGNGKISVGTYTRSGNDIQLYPLKQEQINFISAIRVESVAGYSDTIDIVFLSKGDKGLNVEYSVIPLDSAAAWTDGKIKNPEALHSLGVLEDSTQYVANKKESPELLALCLTSLENLLGKKMAIPVPPNAARIVIVLNLPPEITRQAFVFDKRYTDLNGTTFRFPGVNVRVGS